MKKLSLHVWLACAFVLMLTIVLGATLATVLVAQQTSSEMRSPNRDAASRAQAIQVLLAHTTQWTDPTFQHTLGAQMTAMGVLVVIKDPSGKVLYRSNSTKTEGSELPFSTIALPTGNGGQLQATALLYESRQASTGPLVPQQILLLGVLIFLLTLVGVTWWLGQTLLRPLAALSTAARSVAAHDLNFSLPASSIRELAEVADAFEMMREALSTSLSRQAELEQERRLFISAIAHDLRTPLFTLRGYLQGFAQGLARTPEKATRYLQVCHQQAEALEQLIDDLFTYAQLEYLEVVPKRELLELGELLRRVMESIRPQMESKGITLVKDGPAEPCWLMANAHLLARAFGNLLDNALHYTPAEGTIVLSCQQQETQVQFSVTDTGLGIVPEDLPHLFTPLFRGEYSRNRRSGGAGLGLTIAQRILQAHGGDLAARNATTGGATFLGHLPAMNAGERGSEQPSLYLQL